MYLEQRLIAMLDVLGFSTLTESPTKIADALNTYTRMIAHAKDRILISRSSDESNRNLDFNAFASTEFAFDTLVLISLPLDAINVGAFINATCELMSYFAMNNMPLRGAIGIGDYVSSENEPNTRISASTISKILSAAEQQQEWSGCYIIPEYESKVIEYLSEYAVFNAPSQSSALYRYCVPLKCKKQIDAYCLNWVAGMSEEDNGNLMQHMIGYERKKSNTEKFISYHKSLPRAEYVLPANFYPAVKATVSNCGPGVQIHLWDADGRRATSIGCKHIIFDPQQSDVNAFRGYDTDEEEVALRDWW